MNTSEDDARQATAEPADPARLDAIRAARAIWPGSPTPALTYPDPPRPRVQPRSKVDPTKD